MSLLPDNDPWSGVTRWEPPMMGAPAVLAETPTVDDVVPEIDLAALELAAREQGHTDGLQEGREAARRELEQSLARLEGLLVEIARPLQSLDEATEREMAQLAMVVARRVIAHELRIDPTLIQQAVHEAVAALPSATRSLRVHLHPDDLALLRELGAAEAHWELLSDPGLSRGDCRLESESSRLDARVQTRLASIVGAVLGDEDDNAEDAA